MSIKAYEEYKDSGVEWLGEVPAHWVLKKIAWHVPYTVGWTPSSGKEEYYTGENLWVTIADLTDPVIYNTKSKISDQAVLDRGGKISPAGSMLFSFKLTVGNVSFLGNPAYTNEAIASFQPNNEVDLKYWSYIAPNFIPKYGRENIYGALLLNQDLIDSVRFYCPDIIEQKQISKYLDHETARIDALIEEQQRLISLLKEKRQAVISHAVTKGLDPNVPMKDSGVEWLGEVPEHWRIGSLGYLASINTGATPDRNTKSYWGGEIPWVKTGEVNYSPIHETEEHITLLGLNNSAANLAPKGTLLMAMYGQGVTRGRVAILRTDAAYNQACAGITPCPILRTEYLHDFFMAAYKYVRDGGNETSQMNLSTGIISKFKITVPPLLEQTEIEEYLKSRTSNLDSLVSEANTMSDFLQERRSALISAAVTGKIDVRDWQPPKANQTAAEPAEASA